MRREVPAIGRRRDSIVVPSEVYPFVSFALQNLSNKGWQFAVLVLHIYLTYRVIRVTIGCELGAANALASLARSAPSCSLGAFNPAFISLYASSSPIYIV